MRSQVLGLDLLGGDASPETFIPALSTLLDEAPHNWRLALFSTASFLESFRTGVYHSYLHHPALWVIPVTESVQMEELPLHVVRHKKDSSLMQGIHMLREKTLDVLLSTGNTGALVTAATVSLPLLSRVRRLGLLAYVPTRHNPVAVIDVGATLEPTVADLMQFTRLGVHHLRSQKGIAIPRVGLLNVGSEDYKGTSLQHAAHAQLSAYSGISFVGNVESEGIYQGAVDLVVTDGYSGNIFLKTSEAVRDFVYSQMLAEITLQGQVTAGLQLDLTPFSHLFEQRSLQSSYAYLLGTPFCLIKCHGALEASLLLAIVHQIWSMP